MKKYLDVLAALGPQPLSHHVFGAQFAPSGESTALQVQERVARNLAEDAQQQAHFVQVQQDGFVPEASINNSAGWDGVATMVSCFVQPVADTLTGSVDGLPGIMDALAQVAQTMRRGGCVGFDFSRLRPKGANLSASTAQASGPLAYLEVFDRTCDAVATASAGPLAQRVVLRVDHPDVFEFIDAKRPFGLESLGLDAGERRHLLDLVGAKPKFGRAMRKALAAVSNFNLCVGITDEFMQAVADDRMFDLVHVAQPSFVAPRVQCRDGGLRYVYRTVRARDLWERIIRCAYETGELAVLNLDTVARANSLGYVERIEAISPGGEQPLPPYGSCCLGSANLTRFVLDPFSPNARFDYEALGRVVAGGVEMLDRVLDVRNWPLPQQAAEAAAKRRIGLGFFGLADAMAMLGLRYGTPESVQFAAEVARTERDAAYKASVELARQFGPFPLFDPDHYLKPGTFASTLPQEIQDAIRTFGIRNSHLLAIAPTDSIALAFGDNASPGIDPIGALTVSRNVPLDGVQRQLEADAYALRVLKVLHGEQATAPALMTAQEVSAQEQLAVAAAVAPYVDASIGNTLSVPEDFPFEQFEAVYRHAWQIGLQTVSVRRSIN